MKLKIKPKQSYDIGGKTQLRLNFTSHYASPISLSLKYYNDTNAFIPQDSENSTYVCHLSWEKRIPSSQCKVKRWGPHILFRILSSIQISSVPTTKTLNKFSLNKSLPNEAYYSQIHDQLLEIRWKCTSY